MASALNPWITRATGKAAALTHTELFAREIARLATNHRVGLDGLLQAYGIEVMERGDEPEIIASPSSAVIFALEGGKESPEKAHFLAHLLVHMRYRPGEVPVVSAFEHLPFFSDRIIELEADAFARVISAHLEEPAHTPSPEMIRILQAELVNVETPEPSGPELKELRPDERLMFFCGFDLVGSTLLKTRRDAKTWMQVMADFYKFCGECANAELRPWKIVGDEVLFFADLDEDSDVAETVANTYSTLKRVQTLLRNKYDLDHLVDVKALAWVCRVQRWFEGGNPDKKRPNSKLADTAIGLDPYDFVGQNIDAGFRLEPYARKGMVTISPGLASLLLAKNFPPQRLHIAATRKLKGVGDETPTPIVWYLPDTDYPFEHFDFIDRAEDPLVHEAVPIARIECQATLNSYRKRLRDFSYFFATEP